MKLLVAGIYPPDVGGPATYAVLLEHELPRRGIEVAIAPFASVRHLPPLIRHAAYAFRLLEGLKTADILFVQDTVSSGLPAVLASWIARKPLVVRIGGDYAWEQGTQRFGVKDTIDDFQKKRYGSRVELLRMIQKFVVRRAHVIIAPSHYLGTLIEGWSNGKKVEVVYNGVEFPLLVNELKERPEGVLIVSAGRLVPWKGFDGLIKVIARNPNWKLAIVGDGDEKEFLFGLAQELQCEDRVIFTGNLLREEMLGWCRAADVFVLNSSYEGLSHILIEVQSIGTPTVATNIGGNKEVITDGENGVLIQPKDEGALGKAIEDLLADEHKIHQLREKGRERAKDFSIDITMDALVKILHTLK